MASKYLYLPELDYYFYKYWEAEDDLIIYNVPIPVIETAPCKLPQGTFIEMLFNNVYAHDTYETSYKLVKKTAFSNKIMDRLSSSSKLIECYINIGIDTTSCPCPPIDTTGINLFMLDTDEILMLDQLLIYRTGGSPVLTSYDIDSLSTPLSKLIYIYLDLMVNMEYKYFNTDLIISSEKNRLETLYELYIMNEAHKMIQNWTFMMDADLVELRPVRQRIKISEANVACSSLCLSEPPYDDTIYLFHNGIKVSDSLYNYSDMSNCNSLTVDTTGTCLGCVSWVSGIDINVDDVVIVDYYTKVNPTDVGTDGYDYELKGIKDGK